LCVSVNIHVSIVLKLISANSAYDRYCCP